MKQPIWELMQEEEKCLKLQKVIFGIKNLVQKSPVLFYDEQQVVGPSGIDVIRFEKKMDMDRQRRLTRYYTLLTQMRVKGGSDYISYIKGLLSGSIKDKKSFTNYEFYIVEHFELFNRLLLNKEAEFSLSRMVAGYAWDWSSKRDKTKYDVEIEGIKKQWNHCTEGWVHSPEAIDEIGCIHSTQGYDLNYAFVIIGKEIGYNLPSGKFIVRPECYFDKNGKNTATHEELLDYIKHIYYVLMTRGIRGTYLYVCDEGLREYLKRYIAVWEENSHETGYN